MMDTIWLSQSSAAEEAAALTAHLVSIKSYPGEEGNAQRAIGDWLAHYGIGYEFMATTGDRPNVIARIKNGAGPTLLLNGHVDTVLAAQGWSCDPWQGKRDGDKLYGLGACDMKAGVAANMLITRALAQRKDSWRGTVIFTSVVDEEAYSIGALALVKAQYQADLCIVTEPSWPLAGLGATGKVLVRADITGKAAHGFWPTQGVNAAVEGAKLIAKLDDIPLGRHPRLAATQCVLSFHSGNAQYVITVPEQASFIISRLIVPGETGETVLAEMEAWAKSLHSPARFTFHIDPPYYPPWEIAPTHPMVQQFAHAYTAETNTAPQYQYLTGVADSNYFAADLGIPTIYFGPHGEGLHQCDEWVDVPSIGSVVRVILRLATQVLQ